MRNATTVCQYIADAIASSEATQREIATAIGYQNANVISMIKSGKLKLPIQKVGPIARALGIDPVYLLRLTLLEYSQDTWEAIEDVLAPRFVLSDTERTVVQLLREATGGGTWGIPDERLRRTVMPAFLQLAAGPVRPTGSAPS